jgi:hypothetical protein
MGGRRQNTRDLKPGIYIIGKGITEQYYFSHLRELYKLNCKIRPRLFKITSIKEMETKIEDLLSGDVFIICVFDADVSQYNAVERERLENLYKNYGEHENVLICDSLPSIEFWFLIHYIDTNKVFNSSELKSYLKNYIPNYETSKAFLEKDKWVKELCSDNKLNIAIERAKRCNDKSGSYSNLYKAFKILIENKRS